MVRVAVDVPLHRLFHNVEIVRRMEVARSGISETNESVSMFAKFSITIRKLFDILISL